MVNTRTLSRLFSLGNFRTLGNSRVNSRIFFWNICIYTCIHSQTFYQHFKLYELTILKSVSIFIYSCFVKFYVNSCTHFPQTRTNGVFSVLLWHESSEKSVCGIYRKVLGFFQPGMDFLSLFFSHRATPPVLHGGAHQFL